MNKIYLALLVLIFPLGSWAHPDWKHELELPEPAELVGNVRAFVADSANIDFAGGGGESWHGIQVRISLPEKYDGKWVTLLYKGEPKLKSGEVLKLGDYVQFKISKTEWVHLSELKEFRILTDSQLNKLFQATYE